jgi:hypothetical protein
MKEIKDGEFPIPGEDKTEFAFPSTYRDLLGMSQVHKYGMTLRDYFAAKALTTMFYPAIMESIRTDVDLDCDKVAGFAYTMADAMLKARGQA